MGQQWKHVPTHLRLSRDTLALIDATVEKARAEFDDPEIDRQRVLELLLEHRIETLKRDGGMEDTRFLAVQGSPDRRRVRGGPLSAGPSSTTRSFGGWGWRLTIIIGY